MNTIILNICILYISSYIITWFVVEFLNLSALYAFVIFCLLNTINGFLQTYLFPLRYLEKIRKSLDNKYIYGTISLGLLVGPLNLMLLIKHYGIGTGLFVGIVSSGLSPLVYGFLNSVKIAKGLN
jgi:hypothetical protein